MNPQPNENRPFSSIQAPKIPDWVDTEHPDFPKYFSVVVLDDKGNPVKWWERLPEALISHQNIEEYPKAQEDDSVVQERKPVVHIDMLPDGWASIEIRTMDREYFEISTGYFYVTSIDEVIRLARKIAKLDFERSEFWDSAGRTPRNYYAEKGLRDCILDLHKKGHIRNIESVIVEEIIRTR